MQNFFDKLRNRPESERKRILLTTTSIITTAIFLIWAVNFRASFSETKTVETNPFSVLKDNLSNAYQGFTKSFQAGLSSTTSISTSTPEFSTSTTPIISTTTTNANIKP